MKFGNGEMGAANGMTADGAITEQTNRRRKSGSAQHWVSPAS